MTTRTCIVSQAENNDVSEKRIALIYGEIPPVFIILYVHVLYDPFDSVTVLNMVSPFSIIRHSCHHLFIIHAYFKFKFMHTLS